MQHGLPTERSKASITAEEAILAERLNQVRQCIDVDWESDDSDSREAGTHAKHPKLADASRSIKNPARSTFSAKRMSSASALETGALRMMGMDPTTMGEPDALASAWNPDFVFMDKLNLSSTGLDDPTSLFRRHTTEAGVKTFEIADLRTHGSSNAVWSVDMKLRLRCPVDVLEHLREFRLGGEWRDFDFKNSPFFQFVFYFGERIIGAVSVQEYMDAPYIKNFLDLVSYASLYNDPTVSAKIRQQRKLNLARQLLSHALCDAINDVDRSHNLHSRFFSLQADNNSQMFIEGSVTMQPNTLIKALKVLGITRISLQSTGGNQPLNEFLDPLNPEMAIWISHAREKWQYCGCDMTLRSPTAGVAQAFTLRSDYVAHCCGETTIVPDNSTPGCPGRKHGTVIVKNFLMEFPPKFYTDTNVEAHGTLLQELQSVHGAEETVLKNVAKVVCYSDIIRMPRCQGAVSKESISKKISTQPKSNSLINCTKLLRRIFDGLKRILITQMRRGRCFLGGVCETRLEIRFIHPVSSTCWPVYMFSLARHFIVESKWLESLGVIDFPALLLQEEVTTFLLPAVLAILEKQKEQGAVYPDQFGRNAVYTALNVMGHFSGQYEKHFGLSNQSIFHGAYSAGAVILNENIGFACGGFIALPTSESHLKELLCKKPWSFAQVKIQQNKAILQKASGVALTLDLEDYKAHFGEEKGSELFDEITVVMLSDREAEEKRDLVYIAIWKIFRCDWVDYIASVQRKRPSSNKWLRHVFSGEEAAAILAGYSVLTKVSSRSRAIMAEITDTYGIPVNEDCLQPGFNWRTGSVTVDMQHNERFIRPRNLANARCCILNIKSAKKLLGQGVVIPDKLNSCGDTLGPNSWFHIYDTSTNSQFPSLSTFFQLQQDFLEFKSAQAARMEECLKTVDMADATDLAARSTLTRRIRPEQPKTLRRSNRNTNRPDNYCEADTFHGEGLNFDSDASSTSASNYSLDDEESHGRGSPHSSGDIMSD